MHIKQLKKKEFWRTSREPAYYYIRTAEESWMLKESLRRAGQYSGARARNFPAGQLYESYIDSVAWDFCWNDGE